MLLDFVVTPWFHFNIKSGVVAAVCNRKVPLVRRCVLLVCSFVCRQIDIMALLVDAHQSQIVSMASETPPTGTPSGISPPAVTSIASETVVGRGVPPPEGWGLRGARLDMDLEDEGGSSE